MIVIMVYKSPNIIGTNTKLTNNKLWYLLSKSMKNVIVDVHITKVLIETNTIESE